MAPKAGREPFGIPREDAKDGGPFHAKRVSTKMSRQRRLGRQLHKSFCGGCLFTFGNWLRATSPNHPEITAQRASANFSG